MVLKSINTCQERDSIDYKTSMITDEDPPRGLLLY